jgi:ubiquinone/menaquinone biosynthesis C-methylase UbiE
MKLLKSIHLYIKLATLFFKGRIIRKAEYKEEYNEVSKTYSQWIERMKKFTDEILRFDLLKNNKQAKILDFACGTGYITKKLIDSFDYPNLKVIAVDISEKMLEIAQSEINDLRCDFIRQDGLGFLEMEETEKYDAIYCGFALPYFNQRKVVKQFARVLKKNGTVHLILNCKGTLEGMFEIYFDLMKEYPSQVTKIMEIGPKLPKSEKSLKAWFTKYRFDTISLKTVNEWLMFETPNELYKWLRQTGAIAGTSEIFKESKTIENKIIEQIQETLAYDNQYRINHKFILAVFRKST